MDKVLNSRRAEGEIWRCRARRQTFAGEAEAAVRTLIQWAGDNPDREGCAPRRRGSAAPLRNGSPAIRTIRANTSSGRSRRPAVTTRSSCCATFVSSAFCEHHIAPIIGRVHIGYFPATAWSGFPNWRGWSTVYARRLQIQEKMTAEIATCSMRCSSPRRCRGHRGAHQCMTTRGVHKPGVSMVTSRMLGVFRDHAETRQEFLSAIGMRGAINATGASEGRVTPRA